MKTQSVKYIFMAWGLLISLTIPLLLNAMHYVIFHHHQEETLPVGLQFQSAKDNHILCSYPFVTEELSNASVHISPKEYLLYCIFTSETIFTNSGNYLIIRLRGPPNKT